MDKMNSELLHNLSKNGIMFYIRLFNGVTQLSEDEVIAYVKDPLKFEATFNGVSVDFWNEWVEHYSNPVCHALNKKGLPCGGYVHRIDIKDYSPSISNYCFIHGPENRKHK